MSTVSLIDRLRYRWQSSSAARPQPENFYSQYGQDRFVVEFFERKTGGVFVDIGANDGESFSNTLYLESELNWTGVAFDPHPDAFEKLRNRRKCVVVQACVGDSDENVEFLQCTGYAEMLSGVMSKYHPEHLERIERDIKEHGGTKQVTEVPGVRLKTVLEQNGIESVDYLSLDTEGGEYEILKSIIDDRIPITLITVENPYGDARIWRLMRANGYQLAGKLSCDEVYVQTTSSFGDVKKDVMRLFES